MAIRVTYFYSACVRIDTPAARVLCDPWFTDGAYDGSWFQFPRLEQASTKVGKVDFIYISHIHPDHYDPQFLRSYLAANPSTKLLIARFAHPHLERKMQADGFSPTVTDHVTWGSTEIHLVPNEVPDEIDPNDIDSALVVRDGADGVVNMNDNLFNPRQISAIRELCPTPQIALLCYTGAGPYPQTYFTDPVRLRELSQQKKEEFFRRYRRMRDAIGARVNIPFAGKYLLGGKLAALNDFRGVADAVEVRAFDPSAVVLDDGGDASIDTETLVATRIRNEAYSEASLRERLREIRNRPMAYETWMPEASIASLPLKRLAQKAYAAALTKSQSKKDYFMCISAGNPASGEQQWFVFNTNPANPHFGVHTDVTRFEPRSEISLDARHLFGLLTGVYHWNNAEVGSHLKVYRQPDVFDRDAQRFLNFFAVC
jgi:UDP-MurNAc hydroxylase